MIPIAGVSRSSQMLLCRKSGKAMKERPSWLGDGVVPLTQVWSMRLLLNTEVSRVRGEGGERHGNPKRAPFYNVEAGQIWRRERAGILN